MKKIVLILLGIFLFVNLSKGQDYYQLGNEELGNRNYEKAIEYYTLQIQKYNGWGAYSTYFSRGLAYIWLMKYDDAIVDYTKAIELKPDFAEAFFNRGIAYGGLEKNDEVIVYFTKSIELMPYCANSYFTRGITYYFLQKYHEAIADFTKAIDLTPNYAGSFYFRGLSYDKLQNFDEAMIDYTKAEYLNYKSFIQRLGLSVLYYKKQNYDEAKVWMNNAIVVEPKLNEGMNGIEKLEKEGWNFTIVQKETFNKIFEMLGK